MFDSRVVPPIQLAWSGELDLCRVASLEAELQAAVAEERDLVIDMSGVTFACARPLGLLATFAQRQRRRGRALVVTGVSSWLVSLFRLLGCSSLLGDVGPQRSAPAANTGSAGT